MGARRGDAWWRSVPSIVKAVLAVAVVLLALAVGYYVLTLILIGIGTII